MEDASLELPEAKPHQLRNAFLRTIGLAAVGALVWYAVTPHPAVEDHGYVVSTNTASPQPSSSPEQTPEPTASSTPPEQSDDCNPKECQAFTFGTYNVYYQNIRNGEKRALKTARYIASRNITVLNLQEVENASGMMTVYNYLHSQAYDCDVIDPKTAMRTMTCWKNDQFALVPGSQQHIDNGHGRPVDGLVLQSLKLKYADGSPVRFGDANTHGPHGVNHNGKPDNNKAYDQYDDSMDATDQILATQREKFGSTEHPLPQQQASDENVHAKGDITHGDSHFPMAHFANDLKNGQPNPNNMTSMYVNPDAAAQHIIKVGSFKNDTPIDNIFYTKDSWILKYVSTLPLHKKEGPSDHDLVAANEELHSGVS